MGGNRSCPRGEAGEFDATPREPQPAPQERRLTGAITAGGARQDSAELGAGADPADVARQHLSRLTHGFWLEQYSGLHAPESPRLASSSSQSPRTPGAVQQPLPPAPSLQECQAAAARDRHQDEEGRSQPHRCRRQLARLAHLVLHPGVASSTEQLAGESASRSDGGARSAPPVPKARERRKRPRLGAGRHQKQQQQLGHSDNFFGCQLCGARSARSSSSRSSVAASLASASLAPGEQASTRHKPRLLTKWLLGGSAVSNSTSTLSAVAAAAVSADSPSYGKRPAARGQPGGLLGSAPSSRLSSPYKQLVRLLGGSGARAVEQQVASGSNRNRAGVPAARGQVKPGGNLLASLFVSPTKRRLRPRRRRQPEVGAPGHEECAMSSKRPGGPATAGGVASGAAASLQSHEPWAAQAAQWAGSAARGQLEGSPANYANEPAGGGGGGQAPREPSECESDDAFSLAPHARAESKLGPMAADRNDNNNCCYGTKQTTRGERPTGRSIKFAPGKRREESSCRASDQEGEEQREVEGPLWSGAGGQVGCAISCSADSSNSSPRSSVASSSLLPPIQPLASSSSSLASSAADERAPVGAGGQLDVSGTCSLQAVARGAPEARPRSQPVGGEWRRAEQLAAAEAGAKATSSFKKFVKRQQSVDSYRMARDLKQKQRRQQGGDRNKHQSNEAIKVTRSVGDEPGARRKFSMLAELDGRARGAYASGRSMLARVRLANGGDAPAQLASAETRAAGVEICVDPYARPGSFVLPGEEADQEAPEAAEPDERAGAQVAVPKVTPPKTLSLVATGAAGGGSSNNLLAMGSDFSGCITPTYPTHHLPSPKYVSSATLMAMQKKYSNASTISSTLGADLAASAGTTVSNTVPSNAPSSANGSSASGLAVVAASGRQLPSDTESSLATTPTGRASRCEQPVAAAAVQPGRQLEARRADGSRGSTDTMEREEALAAQQRANLAEHIYDNKCGLGEDMKFLASLPELCDITFLVGETREPVCAVKSVLAARSRVFNKIFFGNRVRLAAVAATAASTEAPQAGQQRLLDMPAPDQAGASGGRAPLGPAKSSLPSSRSTSPNQQQQQQWSVTSDASGYNAVRPLLASRADSSVAPAGGQQRGGRVSVASNGRESISRASQGSQQPLIIGPGQTATPAPKLRNKKHRSKGQPLDTSAAPADGASKNKRLSRMFTIKRASDPSIKHNQAQLGAANQAASGAGGGADAIGATAPSDAMAASDSSQLAASMGPHLAANQNYLDKMKSTMMIIEEFEPDVFRQLIEYIHTGCVLLQARTLLGLLNAADYYGLEQLRKACLRFVSCCITVDTVCSLLATAERYIQYKCTKSIVQKVLEFVDMHANEIFKLNAFGLLPEHVVRLILARDGLQADEHHKFNGVYTWCKHYCRSYELTNIADIMQNFLDLIKFHKIPTSVLLSEIYPSHIVPDDIFLSALAYQAEPGAFEAASERPRRMTLPNTTTFKDYEDEDEDSGSTRANENDDGRQSQAEDRRQSNSAVGGRESGGPRHRLALSSRKSTGGASSATSPLPPPPAEKTKVGRKGSIAQASISGVKRLSHKLSIRKRHSNVGSTAAENRRRGSGAGLERASATPASKQSSLATSLADHLKQRDPIQVGRQILDAYLLAQRQRELQQEEARRREEAERQAAEEAKRRDAGLEPAGVGAGQQQQRLSMGQQQRALAKRPLVKTPSASRKSFRDFKHISRRLFMRHSASKTSMLQQQNSIASITSNSLSMDRPAHESGGGAGAAGGGSASGQSGQPADKSARRLLKIKRSETVYETTPTSSTGSRLFLSSSKRA